MASIIRNTLIRLTALIEQIWRGLIRTLSKLGTAFGKLAGLSESAYYVEEGRSEQSAQSLPSVEPPQVLPQAPSVTAPSRRRAGREVDSFRKMAQQIKQDQRN